MNGFMGLLKHEGHSALLVVRAVQNLRRTIKQVHNEQQPVIAYLQATDRTKRIKHLSYLKEKSQNRQWRKQKYRRKYR